MLGSQARELEQGIAETGEPWPPDEQAAIIDELVGVGRDAAARGLVVASGGNLSARIPGGFLVTAAGTWFDRLTSDGFSIVDDAGAVVGGHPSPSTEWKLHWRTYQARPDVNAVVHLHPQTAVVLDALGHEVRLLTLDHVTYLRRVARIPFFANGSDELADACAEASREANVVILAHHGCSSLGGTVAMAYRRALNLEEAARTTFRCLQLGNTTTTFPPELLDEVRHE